MSKVILYIATSKDGFIAGKNNELDWLKEVEREGEDYGYKEFYSLIDALIMGSKTYEVVSGFGDWVYAGKPTYVLSAKKLKPVHKDITITSKTPDILLSELGSEGDKKIWLVGGGELTTSMVNAGLVDEMIISIVPVELGEGIPLMTKEIDSAIEYELVSSKSYDSDLVQYCYLKI